MNDLLVFSTLILYTNIMPEVHLTFTASKDFALLRLQSTGCQYTGMFYLKISDSTDLTISVLPE
jgi:hypothetical protein